MVVRTLGLPNVRPNWAGMMIFGSSRFGSPASRTATEREGFSESRAASVSPVVYKDIENKYNGGETWYAQVNTYSASYYNVVEYFIGYISDFGGHCGQNPGCLVVSCIDRQAIY